MSKVYFSTTMQQYTRNDHLVLSQQQGCPGAHYSGSPVLALKCVMAGSLMELLSQCITQMTTWNSLDSSRGWNKYYVNRASSQLIGSWRLNAAPHSRSVHPGRPHAAADRFSTMKRISDNKNQCFKNSMKTLATCACITRNSTVNWILLSSTGEMQSSDIEKHLSLTMMMRWYRICMSAWTQCQWNPFKGV